MNREIEKMAKQKKCAKCIHNAVCEKLEELRDPLGWVDVNGEFGCSYYEKSTDVAREIFEGVKQLIIQYRKGNISEYRLFIKIEELQQKYESED